MRVYYRDTRLCITSSALWVRGHRYPLSDIDRAWRTGWINLGSRVATAGGLLMLALAARMVVVHAGWWVTGGSLVLLAAAAGLGRVLFGLSAGPLALRAVEDMRRYGRRLELWASIAGTPVLLIGTDDAIRYGQACRALIRAMDHQRTCP